MICSLYDFTTEILKKESKALSSSVFKMDMDINAAFCPSLTLDFVLFWYEVVMLIIMD